MLKTKKRVATDDLGGALNSAYVLSKKEQKIPDNYNGARIPNI